jgi:4-hydroxymandelate oxidase
VTRDLVLRAENAGYRAVCLTVDMPAVGLRRRNLANAFVRPADVRHVNLDAYDLPQSAGDRAAVQYFGDSVDGTIGWKDLEWLCGVTRLPLVLKGIMSAEDAALAAAEGVDGIVVSNHGGRQLGRSRSTLEALEEVVAAVGGRLPVLFDGGVREPADAVVALALGAQAVGLGRPILWALACGGEAGVSSLLKRILADLRRIMLFLGVSSIDGLTTDAVTRTPFVLPRERPA